MKKSLKINKKQGFIAETALLLGITFGGVALTMGILLGAMGAGMVPWGIGCLWNEGQERKARIKIAKTYAENGANPIVLANAPGTASRR